MNRRTFLTATAATATALTAGCTGTGAPASGDENESSGGSKPDREAATDAFMADLRSSDVQVDSVMRFGPDASFMYVRRPEHERQDRLRVALTYAKHPTVAATVLSVTALEPGGDERYGTLAIRREWADQYNAGEISRSEYLQQFENSFQPR